MLGSGYAGGEQPVRGRSLVRAADIVALLNDPAPDPARLNAAVEACDRAYFNDLDAFVPDQVYDLLVERLRLRWPEAPALQAIGGARPRAERSEDGAAAGVADVEGGGDPHDDEGRVVHRVPMLSLGKCYDTQSFLQWLGERTSPLVASPKIDGAAVAIRYDASGLLIAAGSRGDGRRGDSVLHNVRRVPKVPAQLDVAALAGVGVSGVEVRGEVVLPLSAFAEVADLFANPRNVAAGVLKAKEEAGVPPERLAFFAYDLIGLPVEGEVGKADRLRALGFEPAAVERCRPDEAPAVFERWASARSELDYEIDGVVFRIDDLAEQRRLGSTAHHPRWAVAWKLQGDSGESRLIALEWSLSRTGTITPVAQVEPVELSGAMVSRATLHNLSTVERLGLRVGDRLSLTRRGGVIPHVEASLGGGSVACAPPATCPSCGEPTRVHETEGPSGTRTLRCGRPAACPAVLRGQLFHYTAALEIDGFGPKLLDALIEADLVHDAADLYQLRPETLQRLPRMGATLATRLCANVEARRKVTLPALLVSLGIDSLGKHAADLLATRWTLDELRQLSIAELAALHSLGSLTAARIVEGLHDAAPLLERLLKEIRIVEVERAGGQGGKLAGQQVVFTGKLERMGRRDAQQWVVRQGGVAGAAVTAETTMLVVGGDELAADPPSSKLARARRSLQAVGKPQILSEEAFFALVDAL